MAVFLLKAGGPAYVPPSVRHGDLRRRPVFVAVRALDRALAARRDHRQAAEENNYCPRNPVTRGQMAVFVVKTFFCSVRR